MGLYDYIAKDKLAELEASILEETQKPKKQSAAPKVTITSLCEDFFAECKDDFAKMYKTNTDYAKTKDADKNLKRHIAKVLQTVGQQAGKIPYAYVNTGVDYYVNGAGIGKPFDDGMSLVDEVNNPDVVEKLNKLKGTKEEKTEAVKKLSAKEKDKKKRDELTVLTADLRTINNLFKKYNIVK